jgi:hypothetical protein
MIHDLVFGYAKISEKKRYAFLFRTVQNDQVCEIYRYVQLTTRFLVSFRRCITFVDRGSYYVQ